LPVLLKRNTVLFLPVLYALFRAILENIFIILFAALLAGSLYQSGSSNDLPSRDMVSVFS
jgi:hypothetical protein